MTKDGWLALGAGPESPEPEPDALESSPGPQIIASDQEEPVGDSEGMDEPEEDPDEPEEDPDEPEEDPDEPEEDPDEPEEDPDEPEEDPGEAEDEREPLVIECPLPLPLWGLPSKAA